ncbi:MAG: hypothetical protein HY321_13545 [Armatimonadetes bacterium]|nr:hypothetical protein [Armatimonadota bacterium]
MSIREEHSPAAAPREGKPEGRGKRPGSAVAAVFALGAAAAFLLCGYEFIRSVSTSLFIDAYTADRLPVVMAVMPLGVLLTLYVYGVILSRLGPARALMATSGLSAGLIAACYAGLLAGWKPATGVLYIFREAYIVLIIEQYWSLINSVLSPEQAKRFNGPITGIGSLGSIAGGLLLKRFAVDVGTETFLLYAAASLLPAALCSWLAYTWAGEPQPSPEEAGGRQGHLALGIFARSRYLLLLAALIALTQFLSTALDLRFSTLVEAVYPVKDERTEFYGGFYALLNGSAAALQFLVAPLLLRAAPLRAVHAGIPLVHLAAAFVLLLHPTLAAGGAAYILFKALDYSLFRAGKEILYIPLSFDVRYRAKEVIDAFVYRFAKGGLGLGVTVAGGVLGKISGGTYPGIAMLCALLWLPIVLALTRQADRKEATG